MYGNPHAEAIRSREMRGYLSVRWRIEMYLYLYKRVHEGSTLTFRLKIEGGICQTDLQHF